MSTTLLFDTSNLKLLIGYDKMSFHLFKGLGGNNVNSKSLLTLGETEPELSPGGMSCALAEELGHGRAAVAASQRRLVGIVRRRHLGIQLIDCQ